jgi:hypothetical protein
VSKSVQTQVGRALAQLGIRHIAAYSPEARGRSERGFRTLQDRLPKELALAGIRSQVRSGLAAGGNRWSHLPTESPFQRLFCRPELHRLKADPFRPQGSGRRAEIPLSSTVALLRTW